MFMTNSRTIILSIGLASITGLSAVASFAADEANLILLELNVKIAELQFQQAKYSDTISSELSQAKSLGWTFSHEQQLENMSKTEPCDGDLVKKMALQPNNNNSTFLTIAASSKEAMNLLMEYSKVGGDFSLVPTQSKDLLNDIVPAVIANFDISNWHRGCMMHLFSNSPVPLPDYTESESEWQHQYHSYRIAERQAFADRWFDDISSRL